MRWRSGSWSRDDLARRRTANAAARLLVAGRSVRLQPDACRALGWALPAELVEKRSPGLLETVRGEYAGRTAPELRDEAQRLVAELRVRRHILRA